MTRYMLKIEAFGLTHTFRFDPYRILEIAQKWAWCARAMSIQEI